MHPIDPDHRLLFTKEYHTSALNPIEDELVVGMENALREAKVKTASHIAHVSDDEPVHGRVTLDWKFVPEKGAVRHITCNCGLRVDAYDYALPHGYYTHSLASHFLKWHREQVSEVELAKVSNFLREVDETKRRRREKAKEVAESRRRDRDAPSSSSPPTPGQRSKKREPQDEVVVHPWTDDPHPKLAHTVIKCAKCNKKSLVSLADLEPVDCAFDTDTGFWSFNYHFDLSCVSCPICTKE